MLVKYVNIGAVTIVDIFALLKARSSFAGTSIEQILIWTFQNYSTFV